MSKTCPVCSATVLTNAPACPQCGYKFFDTTQAFAPVSVSVNDNTASAKLLDECTLRIVKGHQVGNVFALSGDSYTLGRSPQCDIFLNDRTVSRVHATLTRKNGGYLIQDADSFNGLWVNNINVKEALLQNGDVIQIGLFCLVYQATPAQ